MHRISIQDEAVLPRFNSHDEARDYFEDKYGEKFVFEEASDVGSGICYFYRLITDEEAYIKGVSDLNANGSLGMEFMKSYQPIRIMEDGSIQIAQ